MKIVAYEDDGGYPAIGIKLDDGVLPTSHTDLTGAHRGRTRGTRPAPTGEREPSPRGASEALSRSTQLHRDAAAGWRQLS